MGARDEIVSFLLGEIADIAAEKGAEFSERTKLFGSSAEIRSRELVELLLAVEDYMEDTFGIRFDWTADNAFSERTSIFAASGRWPTICPA